MAKTKIEWSDATWNPTTGCQEVSEECRNCYAKRMHGRLTLMGQEKYAKPFHNIVTHKKYLNDPLNWKKPLKIFVDSMSDLFHKDVPFSFTMQVFETMLKANWHTYQILTKRPEIMAEFVRQWLIKKGLQQVPSYIWLGVSCGEQKAVSRIDILRKIPAATKFVSAEPLIEMVDANFTGIHQVIAGGESGPHFRQVQKEWILKILSNARKSGTAFYFKQWGGQYPKKNGRLLDGKEYSEFPRIGVAA